MFSKSSLWFFHCVYVQPGRGYSLARSESLNPRIPHHNLHTCDGRWGKMFNTSRLNGHGRIQGTRLDTR